MKAQLIYPIAGPKVAEIEVFQLTDANMCLIPENAQYGNYRIGVLKGTEFWVCYYGRSDNHDGGLRERVREHIGDVTNKDERIYDSSHFFWFNVVHSALDAYKQECEDYHTFMDIDGGDFVDNDIHPSVPDGMAGVTFCPICGNR